MQSIVTALGEIFYTIQRPVQPLLRWVEPAKRLTAAWQGKSDFMTKQNTLNFAHQKRA
jgi:hypothetical protein